MNKLVSILIPAYNAEKWIVDTIKSALNQTWPKKEIIIVDDGSSDNTLYVSKEFESKTVKVITQRNKGASAARNKALNYAQGDYIQWLDADDLLAPDKISQQLKKSDNGENTRTLLSSAFGEFYFHYQNAKFISTSLWQDLKPVEWLLIKFKENLWMNPAVWLISRKLTELVGPWDERLSLDDDGEYFFRIVAASEKVKFISEAKSYYRRGNIDSLSRSASDKACESLFLSQTLCIGYLRSLEDSERTKAACLRYLQNWLLYFYPEKNDLLCKINDLARELGGSLSPPKITWKYSFIRNLFGWKFTKKLKKLVSKAKLLTYYNLDRLLFYLILLFFNH